MEAIADLAFEIKDHCATNGNHTHKTRHIQSVNSASVSQLCAGCASREARQPAFFREQGTRKETHTHTLAHNARNWLMQGAATAANALAALAKKGLQAIWKAAIIWKQKPGPQPTSRIPPNGSQNRFVQDTCGSCHARPTRPKAGQVLNPGPRSAARCFGCQRIHPQIPARPYAMQFICAPLNFPTHTPPCRRRTALNPTPALAHLAPLVWLHHACSQRKHDSRPHGDRNLHARACARVCRGEVWRSRCL